MGSTRVARAPAASRRATYWSERDCAECHRIRCAYAVKSVFIRCVALKANRKTDHRSDYRQQHPLPQDETENIRGCAPSAMRKPIARPADDNVRHHAIDANAARTARGRRNCRARSPPCGRERVAHPCAPLASSCCKQKRRDRAFALRRARRSGQHADRRASAPRAWERCNRDKAACRGPVWDLRLTNYIFPPARRQQFPRVAPSVRAS